MTEDQTDIAQHMPLLEKLASEAEVIIEVGVGNGNGSTRAFARGIAKSVALDRLYVSVDNDQSRPKEKPELGYWQIVYGDSRLQSTAGIVQRILRGRKADLIYIDTDHTYEQMQCELEVWYPLSDENTMWVFHDTWMMGEYNHMTDAIKEFAGAHPPLAFLDVSHESHGLGIMRKFCALNIGSGQRPFKPPFINTDIQEKWWKPTEDAGCLWLPEKVIREGEARQVDLIVLHHVLEHFGCGEADDLIDNCYRLLKPSGSLLVFVPDLRKLAQRWLTGQIDDYIYNVNLYGAYMGDEADRHKWGYHGPALRSYLEKFGFKEVKYFDWRVIEGADLAKDWWILSMEAVK